MDASQPSFYHITDPLQHLNLEVTLKRVHGGGGEKKKKSGKKKGRDGGGDASDNDDSDDETSSPPLPSPSTITSHLTWQQKLFGPRELALLSPPSTVRESGRSPRSPRSPRTPRTALWKATGAAGGAAGGSACDEDYRAALHQRFFDGSDPLDDLASSMIFTYVDKDSFVPKSSMAPSLATTAAGNDPHLNPLGVARATLPLKQMGRSLLPAASVGMKKHLTRETPFRIMYVMAAVDVDVPSVTKGSLSSDPSLIFGGAATAGGPRFYEKVLCTIKLHGSGTMEATPGFSVEEQEDPDSTTFSTSHDLSTRQSQGSKVTTFRFATPKGTVYEYSVRNLNGAESVVEEERMAGEEAGRDRRRVEESRNRRGSSFFAHPPPKIPFFLHCSTEIVSATGFQDEGGRLFAEYEVTLPSEWTYAARCPGVNWGGREPPDDRAGTGSTQLSTPCYPKGPHGLPRVSDSRSVATSKFVACLGFVTVVVSVLMGEGYAVWMVAAVVIAVAVGGGGPSGQCDGEILKPGEWEAFYLDTFWGADFFSFGVFRLPILTPPFFFLLLPPYSSFFLLPPLICPPYLSSSLPLQPPLQPPPRRSLQLLHRSSRPVHRSHPPPPAVVQALVPEARGGRVRVREGSYHAGVV